MHPNLSTLNRPLAMASNVANLVFSFLRQGLQKVQSKLAFEDWGAYPQFATNKGLGRVATLSCFLGILWGVHVAGILLSTLQLTGVVSIQNLPPLATMERQVMFLRWCVYVVILSTFHLLEFFITAVYNPSVTTADSFLINHSLMYTVAVLLTWLEFACRWFMWPDTYQYAYHGIGFVVGLLLEIVSQGLRSLAMITCGESFNHLIQPNKKENHVLITHGVYHYLRHPSYVGFFYWVLGTQLVLGNSICSVLFALATWQFFQRRIRYEEHVLLQQFPEQYPAYRASTYIGIPFLARYTNATS